MEFIKSKDGIVIAYKKKGDGPPLVLIHGTGSDHTRWITVLPELERHFTVYAVDRRGRGESGDADSYSIDLEYDDIVAVVESISEPVNLLGHSYGAICCLEASLKTSKIKKLILYEPPIHTNTGMKSSSDSLERVKEAIREGENEKALLIFLQEIVKVPGHEILILRSLPNWPSRLAAAHTIPREEESVRNYVFKPSRFSKMYTQTLLLLGSDSPPLFQDAIKTLKDSIPNSRVIVMPGQQHAAMDTAPEIFLREVINFLMS